MGNISLVENVKKYEADFDKESCIKCWNRYTCSHGCHYEDEKQNDGRKNIYTCMYAKKMTEISIALCAELEKNKLITILNHR